ncbi:Basic-leucine zipper transcription factor family protein [Hibiscus syriacus]|uniref:Basic-leucine zipper transcription factor family protein n=1 Tax=Hibiscus syriacus TaxID=106335 RepID=A0A6A2YBV7_HIBSY|nr:Basic-leucine zipper transcription factor family protein [Hibiscus syriacus]
MIDQIVGSLPSHFQSWERNHQQVAAGVYFFYMEDAPTASSDAHAQFLGASISREGSFSLPKDVANKSVDEVWKEIVAGGGGDQRQEGQLEEMTLEDFLTKAGAVREEDVGEVVNQVGVGAGVYPADPVVINGGGSQFPAFGNNGNVYHQPLVVVPAGGGAMRGKRRAVEEPPLDKATQQKQRRMIKNRESAARSRERKQAYTVELESMVSHLEEENARLLREEAELNKERFKQLMKNLIPVMEKQRPRRVIRRVHSMEKCTAAAPYLFSCQFSVHN